MFSVLFHQLDERMKQYAGRINQIPIYNDETLTIFIKDDHFDIQISTFLLNHDNCYFNVNNKT